MNATEPQFIADAHRWVCPQDGSTLVVVPSGYWECDARLHRWRRHDKCVWQLIRTWTR